MCLTFTVAGDIVSGQRVTLPILDAVTLTAACTRMLSEARDRMAALESLPLEAATPESVLDRWDADAVYLEDIIGPVAILNNVHPDKSVRDAADDCIRELSRFQVEVFQNEALFARVKAVVPKTAAQQQLQKDLIEAFEDTGAALPAEKRARAKAIADRLTELNQEFERNIRENPSRLKFRLDECEGLPASYLARVPRDGDGNIVLGFDYPDFNPFMANARNEGARQRYYIAYLNRGTPRNVAILEEIVALRKELAGLYGFPSYGHFALRRRMADRPETVSRFLDEVRSVVTDVERRDLEELRRLKAEMTNTPLDETTLQRWDVSYYSERLRERRYNIDQEALRQYFPMPQTLNWLLHVSSRLFGITFERAFVPVWHEDVLYLDEGRRDRGVPGRHLSRPVPSRGQVHPRGRMAGTRRQHAVESHTHQRARHELRPRRTHAQRGRDVLPRVRPRASRRSVADRIQRARGYERAARFRRSAVTDLRGMGAAG